MYQIKELKPKTLEELRLPRVIMIGDEKCGKSSTLERIAGIDCLPRHSDICTRQPIVLKLFFDHSFEADKPSFKLNIPAIAARAATATTAATLMVPEEKVSDGLNATTVKTKITARMDLIKSMNIGLIFDSEIVIEIRSNGVPTIELVDLPGLRTTMPRGEPETLPQLTQDCVKKYMDDPLTGAVVCVVDVAVGALTNSKSVLMVQQSPERLKKNTIGIFTKADKSLDYDWNQDETAESSLFRLETYMSGVETYFRDFQYGFVATVNRQTGLKAEFSKSLAQQAEWENAFFYDHLVKRVDRTGKPDERGPRCGTFFHQEVAPNGATTIVMTDKGKQCLGLSALLFQMDTVICRHISSNWLPGKLNEYKVKETEIRKELQSLGTSPDELKGGLATLITRLDGIFSDKDFQDVMLPTIEQNINAIITPPAAADGNPPPLIKDIWTKILVQDLAEKGLQVASPPATNTLSKVEQDVLRLLSERVSKCFDDDKAGDIQLRRFSAMRTKLLQSLEKTFRAQRENFSLNSLNFVGIFFATKGVLYNATVLRDGLKELVVQYLFIPAIYSDGGNKKSFPFIQDAYPDIPKGAMPPEDCAGRRTELKRQLDNLDRARRKLEELRG